ncbi:hypothetical protein [Pseudoalteromonas denitrificans]|uniref:Uncharacterized protein n=1 Tax=Pseudoalteromonas denitrificans DSM 6059 TaxID=1123010 RepID=A0A1I1KTY8_9GAMM|nr:hypothetical protein [Pseudoalteromonas denitrificans]SFC64256.1 hypothetical protein SAMN02745724_02164 [Pseudoalteromonas denitrificans DSM 6059]
MAKFNLTKSIDLIIRSMIVFVFCFSLFCFSCDLLASKKPELAQADNFTKGPFGNTANTFGIGRIFIGAVLNDRYLNRPEKPDSKTIFITPGSWYPTDLLEKISFECSESGAELIKQIGKIKGKHKKNKFKYEKYAISLAKQYLGMKSYKVHNGAQGYSNFEIMIDRNKKVIGMAVIKHYLSSPGQKVISEALKKKLGKPKIQGGYSVTKLIYEGRLNDSMNLEFYNEVTRPKQEKHQKKYRGNQLLITIEDLSVTYLAKSIDELNVNYENSLSECIKSYKKYLKQEIEKEKNKASAFEL